MDSLIASAPHVLTLIPAQSQLMSAQRPDTGSTSTVVQRVVCYCAGVRSHALATQLSILFINVAFVEQTFDHELLVR